MLGEGVPHVVIGLTNPDWSKAIPLLWGGYRGLLFYAPAIAASPTGWIILLAMILTAGSAYVFSKLQTPIYRAEQKILIKPSRPDLGADGCCRPALPRELR